MLGDRIRLYRKKYRYSQKQFADVLGVTQSAVSSWETGIRKPDLCMIERIADVLGESLHSLLDENPRTKDIARKEYANTDSDYIRFIEMRELIEAAELAADTALFRKLDRVPDQYLLDETIKAFSQMNKIGKYELYKYAILLLDRSDTDRFEA
mgnify:CR=1 FL=1